MMMMIIHSFQPFLKRPFKSSTTQRRSRLQHGYCIGVSRRNAQATAGKGLAQGPYVTAKAGVEPTTLRLRVIASTNAPSRPTTDPQYSFPRLKSTTLQNESLVNEQQVFYILDHLRPTAQGLDNIPAWFLRLQAPVISAWVAQLFNLSINTYWIPPNWKTFIFSPVPKIAAPLAPSDYRPIAVVPILSRILERIVVQRYIYPAMEDPLMAAQIKDQFAFRPTGSTTAAEIALLDHVTTLLRSNAYVLIVSMDFTKAFDSVRHSTLM